MQIYDSEFPYLVVVVIVRGRLKLSYMDVDMYILQKGPPQPPFAASILYAASASTTPYP